MLASGVHEVGYGWQWSLVLLPLWGPLAWLILGLIGTAIQLLVTAEKK
jgi:hypothetical protein